MTETSLAAAPAPAFKLAKALGILAITASAVSAEYGSGINYVSVQSLSIYPDVKGLVPLAMFVCGIAMLPKAYLFAAFSRVMPRAGSKHVWLARSLGLPVGFLITFTYWRRDPPGWAFSAMPSAPSSARRCYRSARRSAISCCRTPGIC